MKNKFFLLGLSMCLLKTISFAQNDFIKEPDPQRPLLFSDMPPVLTVQVSELQKIMILSPGSAASILTGQPFSFNGVVRSVTSQNDNKLLTVILKLTGRNGGNLTLSAITADDGTITYTAKVLSFQHGDCYVLKRNGDHDYSFIKKNFYEIVGE
ncbi:MAG TPA: hypothetical protein VGO58_08530 [Chitinophagaceae bacterium]|nr:hypothetical protein [Chitinophagaceae bacterium]